MSRTRVQAAIEAGTRTGKWTLAKSSLLLEAGMRIEVLSADADREGAGGDETGALCPRTLVPLSVIYEDEDLLVVDKPAGLVVHSAPGHEERHAGRWIARSCGGPWTVGDSVRPGIVHRLDKDTSGLLVVAKNAAAHTHLARR